MFETSIALKYKPNTEERIETDDQLKQKWLQYKLKSLDKNANVND